MKRLIIGLLCALGLVSGVALAAPASAAPGNIRMCTVAGGAWISVNVEPGGVKALGGNGACIGETTGYYPFTEPDSFYVAPGWCANYRVQNGSVLGPIYGIQASRSGPGIWHSTYPGDAYNGSLWTTYVYAWTGGGCPV